MRGSPHAATSAGFSAIELVAAIAVTLIVATLGVSVYDTYFVRAQVASAIASTAAVEQRVATYFADHREPPADRSEARLSNADLANLDEHVASIEIADGRIDVRFSDRAASSIAGRVLSLTPFETVEQGIVWVCGNRVAGPGLEPLGFASGVRQAVQVVTPIEPRYLPIACR